MHMEQEFLEVMSVLNQNPRGSTPNSATIISVIDLTLLDQNANHAALHTLQSKLNTYPVAAVCVYPQHLQLLQVPESIKKATVVNFPDGSQSSTLVCQQIDSLLHHESLDEIDYVFPQQHAAQDESTALLHCKNAYQLCKEHHITFKVILETGSIADPEKIYSLSRKIIGQGCDFLKTSTGKTPIGATPLAAYAILRAIQDSGHSTCGLKVSGGIKLPQQAWFYITLAEHCLERDVHKNWFRIGASSLIDELQM